MENETELKKIKNHNDADTFFYWLQEHTEVTEIQGWEIRRRSNNTVFSLGISPVHYVDNDWMWKNRKVLNDWIDRKLAEEN